MYKQVIQVLGFVMFICSCVFFFILVMLFFLYFYWASFFNCSFSNIYFELNLFIFDFSFSSTVCLIFYLFQLYLNSWKYFFILVNNNNRLQWILAVMNYIYLNIYNLQMKRYFKKIQKFRRKICSMLCFLKTAKCY